MNDEKIVQISDATTMRFFENSKFVNDGWNSLMLQELSGYVQAAIREALSREQKWIPCSERLPEIGALCLVVWNGHTQYESARWTREGFEWASSFLDESDQPLTEVTHWMHLPSAPLTDVSTDEVEDRKEE